MLKLFGALLPVVLAFAPVCAQDAPAPFTVGQLTALALQNSRLVQAAELETQKSAEAAAATGAMRYPQFRLIGLGSRLMEPVDFKFAAGSLGSIGGAPFPVTDTSVNAAGTEFTGLLIGTALLPLSQQYKISLALKARRLGTDIAAQKYRLARYQLVSSVEELAFGLLRARKALEASRIADEACADAVKDAEGYAAEHATLPAELLKAKAKQVRQQYETAKLEHAIAELTEQLNRLTGRPLDAALELSLPQLPSIVAAGPDFSQDGVSRRADVAVAKFTAEQASYDARVKAAEYIPDLSLSASEVRLSNTQYLPDKIVSAGLYLNWDIFDWGKRSHELKEKNDAVGQARRALAETLDTAHTDLKAKYNRLTEARQFCLAAQFDAQAAADALRVAKDKYEERALLSRDYLGARAADALAQAEYINALGACYQAQTQFAIASGDNI